MENSKRNLSMLWVFYEASYLGLLVLGLIVPGGIQQIMSGEILGTKLTPDMMFVPTTLLSVALVMSFLSLNLKDSMNRWVNIIVGVVYLGIELSAIPGYAVANGPAFGYVFLALKVVFAALILWYAYRWPKEEIQPIKAPTPVLKETVRV